MADTMTAMSDAYAAAGVDTSQADRGVDALVGVLRRIEIDRPSASVLASGHYASVPRVADNLGIAMSTDGVGSKSGAAEQADPDALARIAEGLRVGAQAANIEIPGGELAVLPELIRGHPSPHGFDLCGTAIGTVALDAIVTGDAAAPGDALVGIPSSGLHSNGYTLARRALLEEGGLALDDKPAELGGATVADALLEPTVIYVRAVVDLLRSGLPVHGLAHITGGGLRNLLRLNDGVGFTIEEPLDVPAICTLVAERGGIGPAEMWDVFNMGCGFVAVVPEPHSDEAAAVLAGHHDGARRIGTITAAAGRLAAPGL